MTLHNVHPPKGMSTYLQIPKLSKTNRWSYSTSMVDLYAYQKKLFSLQCPLIPPGPVLLFEVNLKSLVQSPTLLATWTPPQWLSLPELCPSLLSVPWYSVSFGGLSSATGSCEILPGSWLPRHHYRNDYILSPQHVSAFLEHFWNILRSYLKLCLRCSFVPPIFNAQVTTDNLNRLNIDHPKKFWTTIWLGTVISKTS
jgi:hypothetical protein